MLSTTSCATTLSWPVALDSLSSMPAYSLGWAITIAICSLIILWTVVLIAIVERAVSVRGLFGAAGAR